MSVTRRRGFTLIELLVVIAIIGILASMVFPVFARARESARKAVCLSNVKNIALAIQMYLADNNDTFWPGEHRQEVQDFFNTVPGSKQSFADDVADGEDCPMPYRANPYLRPTVILDEYIKNRDVWRCPSAVMENGPIAIVPGPDWFAIVSAHSDMLGTDEGDVCLKDNVFPPGWGGSVTDSFTQLRRTGAHQESAAWDGVVEAAKIFKQSITTNGYGLIEVKLVEIQDPVQHVVCADGGAWTEAFNIGLLAYPDLCALECANCWCSTSWIEDPDCTPTIQADCPAVWDCFDEFHGKNAYLLDQSLLSDHSRHLGGVNVGWADGHASWENSQRLLDRWAEEARPNSLSAFGVDAWGPMSWCGWIWGCYPCGIDGFLR